MKTMKYVMTNRGPIIFPETIEHRMLKGIHSARAGICITSAGFVDGIDFENAKCHGESESLRMKSCEDDTSKLMDFCVKEHLPWRTALQMLEDSSTKPIDTKHGAFYIGVVVPKADGSYHASAVALTKARDLGFTTLTGFVETQDGHQPITSYDNGQTWVRSNKEAHA